MIAVSDSSPLITLARAKHLDLLKDFYRKIILPHEVWEEVVTAGGNLPGAQELKVAQWVEVKPLSNSVDSQIAVLCSGLGACERSAILLASSLGADIVLIDETRARRIAKTAGLSVLGSVAILEAGARHGKVRDLGAVYSSLLQQGIRFNRQLLNESLGRLGLPVLSKY